MLAPHTLANGAQPLRRALRVHVAQIGPELQAAAAQVFEGMLHQKQFGFGG